MSSPSEQQPVVARLTTPAEMVAALPIWLGYVPTRSLVVACLHEPRGRLGLTMRFDLPQPVHEARLVDEVVRRVMVEAPSRLLLAVYTDEPDGEHRAHQPFVTALCDALQEADPCLALSEVALVRDARFWSYLCEDPACCPLEGRPVEQGRAESQVALLEAEQVLRGQVVLPDRDALVRSLAGPTFLAAEAARQRCAAALLLHDEHRLVDVDDWRELLLEQWADAVAAFEAPPFVLTDRQAACLAASLHDKLLRDTLFTEHEPAALKRVLAELCRRTPTPYDAAVCATYGWVSYCDGAGAELSIVLDRALASDPDHSLAQLLDAMIRRQLPPQLLRDVTRSLVGDERLPRRRKRRRSR